MALDTLAEDCHHEKILWKRCLDGRFCHTRHPLYLMRFLDLVTRSFWQIPRAKVSPCGGDWVRFDLVEDHWMISSFSPQEGADITLIERT